MRGCRRFEPRQVLDPAAPVSIGAMVGPEAFTEVRYLAHHKQLRALERIPEISGEFYEHSAANPAVCCGLIALEGADTVVVALGSVNGTIQEAVDELRAGRHRDRLHQHLFVPPVSSGSGAQGARGGQACGGDREIPRRRFRRHARHRCADGAFRRGVSKFTP